MKIILQLTIHHQLNYEYKIHYQWNLHQIYSDLLFI